MIELQHAHFQHTSRVCKRAWWLALDDDRKDLERCVSFVHAEPCSYSDTCREGMPCTTPAVRVLALFLSSPPPCTEAALQQFRNVRERRASPLHPEVLGQWT